MIDDERLIRVTLNAKLKMIGCTATCVASISEAVTLLNDGGCKQFKAIITDIMMGEMDGFVFRDIVRGMDESIPIFFMTALDPEEGSGFLKRIMEDSYSFYLPKSINPNMLLKRESIVCRILRLNFWSSTIRSCFFRTASSRRISSLEPLRSLKYASDSFSEKAFTLGMRCR